MGRKDHDVGHFVELSNHHKHTFYLLQTGSIAGLSPRRLLLIANIARYHRKSSPAIEHRTFRSLSTRERTVVTTLVAILRIADAADRQRTQSVQSVDLSVKRTRIRLTLKGKGDMLFTKWAIEKRKQLFEEIFGKLDIDVPGA